MSRFRVDKPVINQQSPDRVVISGDEICLPNSPTLKAIWASGGSYIPGIGIGSDFLIRDTNSFCRYQAHPVEIAEAFGCLDEYLAEGTITIKDRYGDEVCWHDGEWHRISKIPITIGVSGQLPLNGGYTVPGSGYLPSTPMIMGDPVIIPKLSGMSFSIDTEYK